MSGPQDFETLRFFNFISTFSGLILIAFILSFSFTFGSKSGNSESPSTVKADAKKYFKISA